MTATAPTTAEMDQFEAIATALDVEQQKRYRSNKDKDNFWTAQENKIFEIIKENRAKSKTYHPDNER